MNPAGLDCEVSFFWPYWPSLISCSYGTRMQWGYCMQYQPIIVQTRTNNRKNAEHIIYYAIDWYEPRIIAARQHTSNAEEDWYHSDYSLHRLF